MSDEETKKRWRVRAWTTADLLNRGGDAEAERLERALNQLDEEHYEIFEVDFERRLIVGCLEDPQELIADTSMPESMGSFTSALMERLSALREVSMTTPPASSPPSEEPEPEDEGTKVLREYTIQGQRTIYLLSGIQAVVANTVDDTMADQRLAAIIQTLFASAPIEETRKSLADIEFYKEHHLKYSCQDVACQSHQVFESAVTKLKARIAAQPAN